MRDSTADGVFIYDKMFWKYDHLALITATTSPARVTVALTTTQEAQKMSNSNGTTRKPVTDQCDR